MSNPPNSSWDHWAYHFFMPRHLPVVEDDNANFDDLRKLFLSFLKKTTEDNKPIPSSLKCLQESLTSLPSNESGIKQRLDGRNPTSCFPLCLPNQNSLLCFHKSSGSQFTTIYGIDLHRNQDCINDDTFIQVPNDKPLLFESKIAIPRFVISTPDSLLMPAIPQIIQLQNCLPHYPTINRAGDELLL